jgi:hypothetical protein
LYVVDHSAKPNAFSEASYNATISKRFVNVVTKVCLEDVHEIAVPLCKNTKHVYDLPLWGSD